MSATRLPDPESMVFFHAHPDDETLAGGALLAAMAAAGRRVAVVTATCGERGEVVPGVEVGPSLAAYRRHERDAALDALGVADGAWLGGAGRYTDSGMRWLAPGVAGADPDAPPECLSRADVNAATEDLVELLTRFEAQALVSYDVLGGYHHPDHVACHHIARLAAQATGITRYELVSAQARPPAGTHWLDFPEQRPRLLAALQCYSSQLRVEADSVWHVGGQRQPIDTGVRLFRNR